MSYKLMIKATSLIGDSVTSSNEAVFADGISSVNGGVCSPFELNTKSKGRKHIVALMSSGNSFEVQNALLKDMLDKQNSSALSIKVQYGLKSSLEQLYNRTDADSNMSDLSMLYTDDKNAYIAGYGDVSAYYYCAKTKTVQKVEFIGAKRDENLPTSNDDSAVATSQTRMSARVKRVSGLNSGDEYLLVGTNLNNVLGEEKIVNLFAQHGENAGDIMISEAVNFGCHDNFTIAHVTVKKRYTALWVSILAILLVAALSVFAASTFLLGNSKDKNNAATANSALDDEVNSDANNKTQKDETSDSDAEKTSDSKNNDKQAENSLNGLSTELDVVAAEITGENSKVSYYIKDLSTGESIESNDSKMYAASLIKLYIMAEIYRQAEAGELTIDSEIENLLTQMITVSDNDACNTLATGAGGGNQELGFEKISDNAKKLGCQYTVQKNDLQAVREVPIPVGNFTSVKDCGLLLEKIYRGELVSPEASEKMLNLLKGQQRRFKIPRDLPSDVVVANKTGETSTAQNDVAIVFADDKPYIICVMINDYSNSMDEAMDVIARMSKITYDYIVK